jgi:GrpB-like predicted nucleotidyltransferase (UPF0157 family)
MEELEYTYKGENGVERRHYFVKGVPRTHHVHMIEIDSEEWNSLLLFRDYLIMNPKTAREYARLKRELVKQFATEREAYQAGKDSFIKAVLQKARENFSNSAYQCSRP